MGKIDLYINSHDHHDVHFCCLAIKWLFLNQEISYLYDLDQIIFCRVANGIIVTNVDWLLHNFRPIIQLQDCSSGSSDMWSLYSQASQTVKISIKYINHVLSPNKFDDKAKKSIISLMETYDMQD